MDQAKIDGIAAMLREARTTGQAIGADDGRPRAGNLAEALAVQDANVRLMAQTGSTPIGYKIGATNQAARDMLGVDAPFRGRLFDGQASASGASLPRDEHFQVWEVEIALRLGRDLPPGDAPFDAAAVEAATAALIPAIEVVGSVFHRFNTFGVADLVSDNAVHGHWVHGAEVTDWSSIDVLAVPASLALDGEIKSEGKGANVDGGPFGSAAGLANELAGEGRMLKAGDYITTGTVTPIVVMGAETEAVADLGPLGVVRLTLE